MKSLFFTLTIVCLLFIPSVHVDADSFPRRSIYEDSFIRTYYEKGETIIVTQKAGNHIISTSGKLIGFDHKILELENKKTNSRFQIYREYIIRIELQLKTKEISYE